MIDLEELFFNKKEVKEARRKPYFKGYQYWSPYFKKPEPKKTITFLSRYTR